MTMRIKHYNLATYEISNIITKDNLNRRKLIPFRTINIINDTENDSKCVTLEIKFNAVHQINELGNAYIKHN